MCKWNSVNKKTIGYCFQSYFNIHFHEVSYTQTLPIYTAATHFPFVWITCQCSLQESHGRLSCSLSIFFSRAASSDKPWRKLLLFFRVTMNFIPLALPTLLLNTNVLVWSSNVLSSKYFCDSHLGIVGQNTFVNLFS